MKKLLFLLISVLFLGSCATIYRDSEGNIVSKEKMEQLKKAAVYGHLDDQRYRIFVDKIHPMGYPTRTLTNDYVVEVSGDSIGLSLPYMGKVYRAPIDGIIDWQFIAPINFYSWSKIKNGAQITITTQHENENLEIQLDIYDNAKAYINIKSNFKSAIGYSGEMQLNDKFIPHRK